MDFTGSRVSSVARVARISSVAKVLSIVRVARVPSVERVSNEARVSTGGLSHCLRTLRESCFLFPFLAHE